MRTAQLDADQLLAEFSEVAERASKRSSLANCLCWFDFVCLVDASPKSRKSFASKRNGAHKRGIDDLAKYRGKVLEEVNMAQERIGRLAGERVGPIQPLLYDLNSQNMVAREVLFLKQEIHNKELLVNAHLFSRGQDRLALVDAMIRTLAEPVLPEIVIAHVNAELFKPWVDKTLVKLVQEVRMLRSALKAKMAEVERFPVPQWQTDFAGFLTRLAKEAVKRATDQEVSYVHSFQEEYALSRCLFGSDSARRREIDAVIMEMPTLPKEQFVKKIVKKAYELMVNMKSCSVFEQSLELMIVFRCLFNRCYELFPDFDVQPGASDLMNKMEALGKINCQQFPIPWVFMRSEDKDLSMRELFQRDGSFGKASTYLFVSMFACNPIDALYSVHVALEAIHEGAATNKNHGNKGDGRKTVICFDDLFSLFFGTILASDIPDIVYIQMLVCEFAPKGCLSPAFEYAQANIEAMITHIRRTDAEKLNDNLPE